MKRQLSKKHWLLWGILPLVLLLATTATVIDGIPVGHSGAAPPQTAEAFGLSPGDHDRGEIAIVRAYPPPQPNNNLLHRGSGYFPGAAVIFTRQTVHTGQGFAYLTLVIGLFTRFYSSARNNAGADADGSLNFLYS